MGFQQITEEAHIVGGGDMLDYNRCSTAAGNPGRYIILSGISQYSNQRAGGGEKPGRGPLDLCLTHSPPDASVRSAIDANQHPRPCQAVPTGGINNRGHNNVFTLFQHFSYALNHPDHSDYPNCQR
jgi:hypothetical protein